MGFGLPAALLGLLVLPWLWWLHRHQEQGTPHRVSSLLLFEGSESVSASQGRLNRLDPVFWRRAAAVALLVLALAGFYRVAGSDRITVWLDDSLSMQTQEGGETRLATALSLIGNQATQVTAQVRPLSRPGVVASGIAGIDTDQAAEPRLPPRAVLTGARRHWLVTDGADAQLNQWAAQAPIEKILRVGQARDNVAVIGLSARRQLAANAWALRAEIRNLGERPERRELVLLIDGEEVERRPLTLAATQTASLLWSAPGQAMSISVRLSPGDLLPDDDGLALSMPSRRAVAIAPDCPASLPRAVTEHPGLELADPATAAALNVVCSDPSATTTGPTLVWQAGASPVPPGPRFWLGEKSGPPLLQSPQLDAAALERSSGEALLVTDQDQVLLSQQSAPTPLLRSGLRPSAEALAPVFNQLLEQLTGETLLDPIVSARRPARASVVAGRDISATGPPTPAASARSPLWPLLLLLAAVLLAWDGLRAAQKLRPAGP